MRRCIRQSHSFHNYSSADLCGSSETCDLSDEYNRYTNHPPPPKNGEAQSKNSAQRMMSLKPQIMVPTGSQLHNKKARSKSDVRQHRRQHHNSRGTADSFSSPPPADLTTATTSTPPITQNEIPSQSLTFDSGFNETRLPISVSNISGVKIMLQNVYLICSLIDHL